jgi:anti-sigma factor RsiW
MKHGSHPEHRALMDFVEGELAPAERERIKAHVAGCPACKAYVASLKRTLALLEADPLPLPSEAFFEFLATRARRQAPGGFRRLVPKFLPGLAAAAAAVVLMWWVTGTPISPPDGIDAIMTQMTTGEIVDAVAADPSASGRLFESDPEGLEEIESYLSETGSAYEMLGNMSDDETARFVTYLQRSMREDTGTSGPVTGLTRKEC